MTPELKRLHKLVRLAECWGDEPSPELLEQVEAEKRRHRAPDDLVAALADLRREWANAAVNHKKNRHVFFLGYLFWAVCEWRRLKRLDEFTRALSKFYEIDPVGRDIFQMLLIATCGEQLNRKIRYTWSACLRQVDELKTPANLGAAQILRLGGINRCAQRSRQKKRRA
jgi:hypothetical protein